MSKKFALLGAAGYIAQRHMQAIKNTGNDLIAVVDPHDAVGILDRYFPSCKFFMQTEKFDRYIIKNEDLDFITVCSPNYLHESHCKLGMRLGCDVICEKPLTTTVENLEQLTKIEFETGKKVYPILQLRLHPSIKLLGYMLDINKKYNIDLKYITPRGPWYFQSWKGQVGKSGGIETNIGIHFFDVLILLFGRVNKFEIIKRNDGLSVGTLDLERAKVKWYLSIDKNDLPNESLLFYRSMFIDGEEITFDNAFSNLHIESYKQILCGNGFRIDDAKPAIKLVQEIRES